MDTKKAIYSILKEVQNGNEPKAIDLGVSAQEFARLAALIKDEGYLKNVAIAATIVWLNNSTLTMKGIEFLEQNSLLAKTYRGIKELRDWIK